MGLVTLSLLQHGFACLDLSLLAEQILFMIRIFLQDQVEACALLHIHFQKSLAPEKETSFLG